jgi:hypothetical protein
MWASDKIKPTITPRRYGGTLAIVHSALSTLEQVDEKKYLKYHKYPKVLKLYSEINVLK